MPLQKASNKLTAALLEEALGEVHWYARPSSSMHPYMLLQDTTVLVSARDSSAFGVEFWFHTGPTSSRVGLKSTFYKARHFRHPRVGSFVSTFHHYISKQPFLPSLVSSRYRLSICKSLRSSTWRHYHSSSSRHQYNRYPTSRSNHYYLPILFVTCTGLLTRHGSCCTHCKWGHGGV